MTSGETSSCAVADVKNIHGISAFIHEINDTVNMRSAAVEEMPQIALLTCCRSPIGIFFEAIDRFFKTIEPSKGLIRLVRIPNRARPDQTA
jgi:hypothetical protein